VDIASELQTVLESLVSALAAAAANPKPSYSIDGQSVSWGEYLKMLQDGIKTVSELMTSFNPVELRSQVL
jgi:hypothetical protein